MKIRENSYNKFCTISQFFEVKYLIVLDKKVYSLKISVSLGPKEDTMETFGKDLQTQNFI